MPLVRVWEAKRYLDYHCFYASVFPLLAVAFPGLFSDLKSRLFLPMSVTFYYSSIKIPDVRRIPLFTLHLLFWFSVTSNSIPPCSGELRACSISISLAADDIFLVKVMTKLLSLLLNILDNSMTPSYNSSLRPNACFITHFRSIMRIFSFIFARFPAQISPI